MPDLSQGLRAACIEVAVCALAVPAAAREVVAFNTSGYSAGTIGLFGLAGMAGVLYGMKYQVFPQMSAITLKSFIAAVFGGLGSLPGALLGSVLLALIETFVSGYLSTQYRDLFAFIILIGMLVVRPSGIMGKDAEDKA